MRPCICASAHCKCDPTSSPERVSHRLLSDLVRSLEPFASQSLNRTSASCCFACTPGFSLVNCESRPPLQVRQRLSLGLFFLPFKCQVIQALGKCKVNLQNLAGAGSRTRLYFCEARQIRFQSNTVHRFGTTVRLRPLDFREYRYLRRIRPTNIVQVLWGAASTTYAKGVFSFSFVWLNRFHLPIVLVYFNFIA